MNNKLSWERCVAFHGHECGGLAIGHKASLFAARLLGLTFSPDEQLVCVAENDACGVDAIQVLLGCSIGKGNLLFHMTGKQAFSFYNRTTGQSVRLLLKDRPAGMKKEESLGYYRSLEPEEMFTVGDAKLPLPEPAAIFESHRCDGCGETTGERWLRLCSGRRLCPDCLREYDRFRI